MTDNNFNCIILAAGFGERMKPLTNTIPKPLVEIKGKSLLEYHLERLYQINCSNIVITTHWLGQLIEEKFKNIQKEYKIQYSSQEKTLGPAGGIKNALKIIQSNDYFIVINGDIFIPNFNYEDLFSTIHNLKEIFYENRDNKILAYLYLVPNPDHNPNGDFYLENGLNNIQNIKKIYYHHNKLENNYDDNNNINNDNNDDNNNNNTKYTFSGIAIYHIDLFQKLEENKYNNLLPLLKEAMDKDAVYGKLYQGEWHDVGNIKKLEELNQ
jgi:MurNAc alpha-1-phosphate uridylyltransferase